MQSMNYVPHVTCDMNYYAVNAVYFELCSKLNYVLTGIVCVVFNTCRVCDKCSTRIGVSSL